jgi:amino acid adenylation domain-containing protein
VDVVDLFERQVERAPDAIAVRCGAERLTYGQLNTRANRLAKYLVRRGAGRDTLVGVAMRRSPRLVSALLGVWKAGAAYVPLDPSYPQERLEFMQRDAEVAVLLEDRSFPDLHLQHDAGNPSRHSRPGDLAYVMYTSGSTGKPKGAMITHGGLLNYLQWAMDAYAVQPGDSVPVQSSIAFDLTVTSLYAPLLAGAEVELLADEAGVDALGEALIRRGGRALVKITPAQLDLLRQQLTPEQAAGRTRLFVIGGENLTAESLRFWRTHAPDTRLINEYGPTETVVGCCVYEVQSGDPHHGPVPIGRPIASTRLHVVDGELCIAGAGVARGYLNRPELTAERFVPDPDVPGARMYRTGDLARWRADGVLEYLGRRDHQVKVRGYRIELGEIEQALAAHPDVDTCAVLAREDAPGERRLVAYAVRRPGAELSASVLQNALAQRLPEFMLPERIVFLEALPLTVNGKVDRAALPAPSLDGVIAQRTLEEPSSDTEAVLARLWRELLHLERIGIHEDVFDLGARSLAAMTAVARIRTILGVDVPLARVFEHPTVAGLAQFIESLGWADSSRVAPPAGTGEREDVTL